MRSKKRRRVPNSGKLIWMICLLQMFAQPFRQLSHVSLRESTETTLRFDREVSALRASNSMLIENVSALDRKRFFQ